jgi:beta-glucosidase-like glycosyl hydrolase/CubicO group peptidase (beta-lactamase class C family)
MAAMTLEEKVGQMVMVGVFGQYFSNESDEYARLVRLVKEKHVGGFILWQGDVYESAVRLNTLQSLSRFPLLVSADFERGVSMRIRRGTPFPDAMAIGATRNTRYAYEVGLAIAREARALGVHQNYAPVADVNTNPLNPVINTRSFGSDPALVHDMVSAFIRGQTDGGVLSTAKHFPGHGDTGTDSHLELPNISYTRERLDSVELAPFRTAIKAGAQSIMIAHLAVPALDPSRSLPSSLSPAVITGVLQKELGFEGLVVTDAMDMRGVTMGYSPGKSSVLAVKAGVDIVLMPPDEEAAFSALLLAARSGEISEERLDRSVRKILAVKHKLGLDTLRTVDINAIPSRIGTRDHWKLSREVARHSITLLKNNRSLLPLQTPSRKRIVSVVLCDTQEGRVDVNRPSNHWTVEVPGAYFNQLLQRRSGTLDTYRLSPASTLFDIDAALARVKRADILVLPIYVKVRTSSGKIDLPPALQPFLKKVNESRVPTVAVLFGNPYLAGPLSWADAVVCAYGDNEPLVEASVEALFAESGICGKLPVNIADQFALGTGANCPKDRLRRDDPSVAGFDPVRLLALDSIIEGAIRDSAFPAAQLAVVRDGILVYNKSFGNFTYDPSSRPIDNSTIFDLASVSKVIGTTSAVMKLYDDGLLGLDDPVGLYLPQFGEGPKSAITIRHLITHRSGFPPFRRFFLMCSTAEEALDSLYATPLVATPGDTTIYSDIGMVTMGKVVEKITGMSLSDFVQREFYIPLGMENTMYNPPAELRERVAPTEIDTLWRKALVWGQVHDENAALLGGVAGHAGLFSSASDLAIYMQMLLNKGAYGGVRILKETTVLEFTRKYVTGQERYLGWDMKSPIGSSAGTMFSPSSFGHTGFTGTSIWTDPDRKLSVILLTNRVHPTRANSKISRVRPVVHDAVIRALTDVGS